MTELPDRVEPPIADAPDKKGDMRVWLMSAWLLIRQRALFLRLLVQRQTLQQEIGDLVEK